MKILHPAIRRALGNNRLQFLSKYRLNGLNSESQTTFNDIPYLDINLNTILHFVEIWDCACFKKTGTIWRHIKQICRLYVDKAKLYSEEDKRWEISQEPTLEESIE